MANTPLANGYNIIMNQKIGNVNTPVYPFTKTALVKDTTGKTLDEIIDGLAPKDHGNHVPDFSGEAVSNLRFLRNDNTWATIQAASTTQAGVVQLTDSTSTDDSTVAATAKAVKEVKDAVDAITGVADKNYVKQTQLGAASTEDTTGVATLDTNGKVPTAQLPSYVDDVIEVKMASDRLSATTADGSAVTPETGKIYVDCVGDGASEKTFRWSGSQYVVISETLALGETASTAFDGARGLAAYNHSLADHARVDATLTEKSVQNGYIKINGSEVLVYTHPQAEGASATNPHGTTAADVGLGKVENKTGAEIRAELTSTEVTDALGFTPANAATMASTTVAGLMQPEQVVKLNNTQCMAVSVENPTFTDGIWFQIVAEA